MDNSKNYWGQTLNEIEKNFCACDCVNDQEQENGEELHKTENLDNLFIDKRNKKDSPNLKIGYDPYGILFFRIH